MKIRRNKFHSKYTDRIPSNRKRIRFLRWLSKRYSIRTVKSLKKKWDKTIAPGRIIGTYPKGFILTNSIEIGDVTLASEKSLAKDWLSPEEEQSWNHLDDKTSNLSNMIQKVFSNLTEWRDLPNYKLELRTDAFFSLYIDDIISAKTGIKDQWHLIPNFPLPIRGLFKVDYLVIGKKSGKVIFLERKTDYWPRVWKQDWYLIQAKKTGMVKLLNYLKICFLNSQSKERYCYLFLILRELGIVNFEDVLISKVKSNSHDICREIQKIEVINNKITKNTPEILYIQPTGTGSQIINFAEVSDIISNKYNDELSVAFAKVLKQWASQKVGCI